MQIGTVDDLVGNDNEAQIINPRVYKSATLFKRDRDSGSNWLPLRELKGEYIKRIWYTRRNTPDEWRCN